ncbi:MAG TPA: VOC family protein [Sphingomicrobium sp.]|jgi:lactoylglutathione lyase|nr:VOC family protein [Sphingomicrobium sp.]
MLIWLTIAASASAIPKHQKATQSVSAVVDHIGLHVADPVVSAKFYQRTLGLKPLVQKVSPTMRWMGSATFQLHLIGGRTKPVDTTTETHFAFRVPNLQDELNVLDQGHIPWTDADGAPHKITKRVDGVLQAYFHDPDGYSIEVNQAPK